MLGTVIQLGPYCLTPKIKMSSQCIEKTNKHSLNDFEVVSCHFSKRLKTIPILTKRDKFKKHILKITLFINKVSERWLGHYSKF